MVSNLASNEACTTITAIWDSSGAVFTSRGLVVSEGAQLQLFSGNKSLRLRSINSRHQPSTQFEWFLPSDPEAIREFASMCLTMADFLETKLKSKLKGN